MKTYILYKVQDKRSLFVGQHLNNRRIYPVENKNKYLLIG